MADEKFFDEAIFDEDIFDEGDFEFDEEEYEGDEVDFECDDTEDASSTHSEEAPMGGSNTIMTQLLSVYEGKSQPQWGIGYDWDMLYAAWINKVQQGKLQLSDELTWSSSVLMAFSGIYSVEKDKQIATLTRRILATGTSDTCRVCREVAVKSGGEVTGDGAVAELNKALISAYLKAYDVKTNTLPTTCKEAYELAHKPVESEQPASKPKHQYNPSQVARDMVRTTMKRLESIYRYALDVVPVGIVSCDVSGEYVPVGVDANGVYVNNASITLDAGQASMLTAVLGNIKSSCVVNNSQLLTGSIQVKLGDRVFGSFEKTDASGNRVILTDPEGLWRAVADDWLNRNYFYLPLLHLGFIQGYYPTETGIKHSMRFSDFKDRVQLMVETVFYRVDEKLSAAGCALSAVGEKLNDLSRAVTNMLLVEEFNSGKLFTLSYDLGNATQEFSTFITTSVTSNKVKIFLSHGIDWLCPIKKANCGLTVARLCYDREAYDRDINFAFKAIRELAVRNKPCDFSNVLLGKTLQGDDVTVDMSVQTLFCIPIMAGAGSGKGVMTLATLGTAIATGHPFVYLDNKPDMADLLWWIEHEIREKYGMDVPILAQDISLFEKSETVLNDTFGTYLPDRIRRNMYRNKDKWVQFFGSETSLPYYAQMALFGKMTQLILSLDNGIYSGSRCVAVVDEISATSRLYPMAGAEAKWSKKGLFEGKLSELKSVWNDKKADEGAKKNAKIESDILQGVVSTLGFTLPDVKSKGTALGAAGNSLSIAVKDFLDKSGRDNKALITICIGQDINALKRDRANFCWTEAVNHSASVKILGRGNGIPAEFEKTGFFAVDKQDADGNVVGNVICKSYLTLNENDYFVHSHRVGVPDRKYTGDLAKGRSDAWIAENLGTPDAPNEAVGFMGYVKEIAKIAPQPMSEQEIFQAMGKGYQRAMEWFSRSGLQQIFGYSCLEDWLYDLDPRSFFDSAALRGWKVTAYPGVETSNGMDDGFSYSGGMADTGEEWYSSAEEALEGVAPSMSEQSGTGTFEDGASGVDEFAQEEFQSEGFDASPFEASTSEGNPQSAASQSTPMPAPAPQPAPMPAPAPQPAPMPAPAPAPAPASQPAPMTQPQPQPIMTDGFGNQQDATQTTQNCSAYNNAFSEPIDMGSGGDTPFACFHSGKKYSNQRIRMTVTEYLVKDIIRAIGGADGVFSFGEQNGVLLINNTPYMPKVDPSIIVLAPPMMQVAMQKGEFASLFYYKSLKKFKNLQSLNFSTVSVVDSFFWSDTGTTINKANKLFRWWKRLRSFVVGGIEILDNGEDSSKKPSKVSEKNVEKASNASKARTFGSALAIAVGLKPASVDKHPIATTIGQSGLMKAVRTGTIATGLTWGASLLIGLSNPFLLIGGAIGAAAYAKRIWNEHKMNKS